MMDEVETYNTKDFSAVSFGFRPTFDFNAKIALDIIG